MKSLFLKVLSIIICLSLLSGCMPTKSDTKDNIPKDAVTLKLMIGRDKQWVFDSVQQVLNKKNIRVNGRPIYIVTEKAGTGEAMDKILQQGSDYVGWMPASSTHIQWANDVWYKKGHTKPIVDEKFTTVFLTPTVIAMQESLAKIMGYPAKSIGWNDILKLSTAPDGWGIYGKSILNPVRFAHTHPAKSNSGLNALIAAEYAFSGKQRGLTLEDIKKNSTKLKDLEQTIVHYGESTSLLQKKIVEKGPKFVQYAVLYEYMVADINFKTPGKEKIVAIYPKEGTIWGDVCFTNVYSTNVTEEQKTALEEIKKLLLSEEIQLKGMNEYFFRPANTAITLSKAISSENGVSPSEPQTTLELPKIEVINAILDDWLMNMKKRANVLFVVDTSGSMSGEPLDNVTESLQNLFDKNVQDKSYTSIDDEDTISLMTFSDKVSDIFSTKGKNIDEMKVVINNLTSNGSTSLYDAVDKAITEHSNLRKTENDNKINMIVVLTDGQDTSSKTNITSLVNNISSHEGELPVIITIGYGNNVDENILNEIAEKAGGKYYEGNPKTIKQVFDEIKTFF